MSNLELGSLGEDIIKDIMEITEEGGQRSHSEIMDVLSQLFEKVLTFVEDALSTRGPNDEVAY